ncbi:unnamed protein product [Meloidogyne enterolobii]|uniref:Uncharacterized protein n=1 Tax=Meloidogyne enterolobii TaxID=390850 RepID=A0ACB1B8H3_MELEN
MLFLILFLLISTPLNFINFGNSLIINGNNLDFDKIKFNYFRIKRQGRFKRANKKWTLDECKYASFGKPWMLEDCCKQGHGRAMMLGCN